MDNETRGTVRSDELLTLTELQRRLGWKAHALRQARRAGLPFIRFGSQKFLLGADLLQFFGRLKEQQGTGGTIE